MHSRLVVAVQLLLLPRDRFFSVDPESDGKPNSIEGKKVKIGGGEARTSAFGLSGGVVVVLVLFESPPPRLLAVGVWCCFKIMISPNGLWSRMG